MEDTTLRKIYKSVLHFLQPLTAGETNKIIVHEGVKLVSASYGSLILEQNDNLIEVYTTLPFHPQRRKRGYTYQAFTKQEVIIKHAEEFGRYHPKVKKLGVKSDIFLPLINKGKSIGVLILNSPKTEELSRKDLELLLLFGSLASLTIRKTELYEEVKNALETRDLFISMAAHELRTPLTTINGYIQLLLSRLPKGDSPESRWTQELYWESRRLSLLINELLEVNRIKRGEFQYHLRECNLTTIINRAVGNFNVTYPTRQINFQNYLEGKPDLVIGDFDKLLQVVNNLIENAIRYSSDSTSINIILKERTEDLVIQVKDQGKGISKKDIARVFDLFYRSERESIEGMGLGLYLVQSIIKEHHGEVKVHSKIGKGTTISVILPKAKF